MRRAGLLVSALTVIWIAAPSARAGDRPVELLVVDMTPDGFRPDCVRDLVRVIRHDHDFTIHRIGSARVRTLTGHADDGSDFTSWAYEELAPVVTVLRTEIDSIALVDCRAEEASVDAWVASQAGGVMRLRLRRAPIDPARRDWLAGTILMHAAVGFGP